MQKNPAPGSRPSAEGIERRSSPRFRPARNVALSCTEGVLSVFGWGNRLSVSELLDLSRTGLKLATPELLGVGSVLRLDFAAEGLPGSMEVFGEVRWSGPIRAGESHAGIEFFGIAARKIQGLRRLCEHLQAAAGVPAGPARAQQY